MSKSIAGFLLILCSFYVWSDRDIEGPVYFDTSSKTIPIIDKSLILNYQPDAICRALELNSCEEVIISLVNDKAIGLSEVVFDRSDICMNLVDIKYIVKSKDIDMKLPYEIDEITISVKKRVTDGFCIVSKQVYL